MLSVTDRQESKAECLRWQFSAYSTEWLWMQDILVPTTYVGPGFREVSAEVAGDLVEGTLNEYNERALLHKNLDGSLFREPKVATSLKSRTSAEASGTYVIVSHTQPRFLVPGGGFVIHLRRKMGRQAADTHYSGTLHQQRTEPGYPPVCRFVFREERTFNNQVTVTTSEYFLFVGSDQRVREYKYAYNDSLSDAENSAQAAKQIQTIFKVWKLYGYLWCDTLYGVCPGTTASVRFDAITDKEVRALYNNYSLLVGQNYPFRDAPKKWGFCCQESIENAKYLSINSIAFLKDLPETLGEIKAIIALLREPRNPKNWAGLFLGAKYGTRLTVADANELVKGVTRYAEMPHLKHSVCRGRQTTRIEPLNGELPSVVERLNYKVIYEPYDHQLAKVMKCLYDWDLWLSFKNLWDLLPFSFVLNWFIDIESVLQNIDTALYSEYLTVLSVTKSRNFEVQLTDWHNTHNQSIVAATLSYKSYSRVLQNCLDLPVPGAYMENMTFPNHLAELAAIVVQCKR